MSQPDTPREIIVAAGLITRENRLLAALRPGHKPWAGYWELPGGKAEEGENAEEALRRELAEELGVETQAAAWLGCSEISTPGQILKLHFFLVEDFGGEPEPLEGQTLRWIAFEDVPETVFLPADREFLCNFCSQRLTRASPMS